MPHTWDPKSLSPQAALQRLIDGNRRFRAGSDRSAARSWSAELATEAQQPFAVVLGCSDSRTPVEILFDEGFGALFVVRVAGNSASPAVMGSIEFAVSQFGTRLVVVMGHSRCGAVGATVHALQTGLGHESEHIRSITDRIAPHVEALVRPGDPEQFMREAIRAHVRNSADQIRHGSALIEELVLAGRVAVVGAEYELETGVVDFFEGVPL
jgi:carbonic anhydrase